jgi:hypothetical protein
MIFGMTGFEEIMLNFLFFGNTVEGHVIYVCWAW